MLAEDGFDALAKVNDYQPHLIFCDILMPRLDGYQTCAIIKRNPRLPQSRWSCCRPKTAFSTRRAAAWSGSQDYLTKPFTKDQLLQAVQQFGAVSTGAT